MEERNAALDKGRHTPSKLKTLTAAADQPVSYVILKKTLSLFLSTGSITDDVIISCDVFRRTELDAKAPL